MSSYFDFQPFINLSFSCCSLMRIMWKQLIKIVTLFLLNQTWIVLAYDPTDKELKSVLPPDGKFEAFYPRETHGIPNGAARAPHGHGSFFKYRNPALVSAKNAAAYGFRFDGKRRFNFD